MAMPIISRVERGRLYFQTADVLFPSFAQAVAASSAAESHRLDIAEPIDTLILKRTEALASMRQAGDDLAAAIRQRKPECGTPRERIRTWTDSRLHGTLRFFSEPKLAQHYTSLLAELRQEITRRRTGGAS